MIDRFPDGSANAHPAWHISQTNKIMLNIYVRACVCESRWTRNTKVYTQTLTGFTFIPLERARLIRYKTITASEGYVCWHICLCCIEKAMSYLLKGLHAGKKNDVVKNSGRASSCFKSQRRVFTKKLYHFIFQTSFITEPSFQTCKFRVYQPSFNICKTQYVPLSITALLWLCTYKRWILY